MLHHCLLNKQAHARRPDGAFLLSSNALGMLLYLEQHKS